MGYKVTAPYITARVGDGLGSEVTKGFYEGGVLPDDANAEDLERLERKGMIAKEGSAEADAAVPHGKPVQFDAGGMPVEHAPAPAKPKPGPKPSSRA
jgi:hypothetical protein